MKQKPSKIILICAAAFAIALSGCTAAVQDENAEEVQDAQTASEKTETAVGKAYDTVLSGIADGGYGNDSDASAEEYAYALENVEGADFPILLVKQATSSGIENVRVYAYNQEDKTAILACDDIETGVAGVGGFRGGLSLTEKDPHLELTTINSGTGDTVVETIDIAGCECTRTVVWEGRMDELEDRGAKDIVWHSFSDMTALEEYSGLKFEPKKAAAAPEAASDTQNESEAEGTATVGGDQDSTAETTADSSGMTVLQGTIVQTDRSGLLELQGTADPNPGSQDSSIYTLLLLDTPQEVEFMSGSGSGMQSGSVSMVLLDGFTGTVPADGGSVTVRFDPAQTWWPSDTSLPIGEPRSSSYELL